VQFDLISALVDSEKDGLSAQRPLLLITQIMLMSGPVHPILDSNHIDRLQTQRSRGNMFLNCPKSCSVLTCEFEAIHRPSEIRLNDETGVRTHLFLEVVICFCTSILVFPLPAQNSITCHLLEMGVMLRVRIRTCSRFAQGRTSVEPVARRRSACCCECALSPSIREILVQAKPPYVSEQNGVT
jgi:hypothetical protein